MSHTTITDEQIETLRENLDQLYESIGDESENGEALRSLERIVSSLEGQRDEYDPDINSFEEYHDTVEANVEALEERIEEEEGIVEFHDVLFETIDGDRVGTMYHESLAAIKYSTSDPHEWSVYVDMESDPSWGEVVNAMAYTVLRQDVMEMYRRRHEDDDNTVHAKALQ